METDALKLAWQTLSRNLERHNNLQTQALLEQRKRKALSSLRPLIAGQVLQALFGLPFVLLAALLWLRGTQLPDGLPAGAVLAGVVVHLYGIVTIAMAGQTLWQLRELDYAVPVVELQKRLASIRRTYVLSGLVAGMPWWFLWVPLLLVLVGLAGGDLYAHAPAMVWSGLLVGAAGLAGVAWFHRWASAPARPRLARAVADGVTGASLRRASAQLEEIARFEVEGADQGSEMVRS